MELSIWALEGRPRVRVSEIEPELNGFESIVTPSSTLAEWTGPAARDNNKYGLD